METATLGKFGVGLAIITQTALLFQADTTAVPLIAEIGKYLMPFNTAVVTLMWYRIAQLEKQTGKLEDKVDRLRGRFRKMHGRDEEDEE
jgi:hypothetical protein